MQNKSKQPSHTFNSLLHTPTICYNLQFKFNKIQDTFSIKIINSPQQIVYVAELNKRLVDKMDMSVLATFGSIEGMYTELVEIVRLMEQVYYQEENKGKNQLGESNLRGKGSSITIGNDGKIKICIEIGLKSGKKYRQLVLEPQKRKMTETEILQQKISHNQNKYLKRQESLMERIAQLEIKLQKSQKKCKLLEAEIINVKKQCEKDIDEVTEKVFRERMRSQDQNKDMKALIVSLQEHMKAVEFDLRLVTNSGVKIRPKVHKKCKALVVGKSGMKNYMIMESQDQNIVKKVGSTGWAQVLLQENVESKRINFYDMTIKQTKNNYICCGFGHETGLTQQDSKWSPISITLFLLDHSIINCGKSQKFQEIKLKNNQPEQPLKTQRKTSTNIKNNEHIKNNKNINRKQNNNKVVRVVLDPSIKKVYWYVNGSKVGQIGYGDKFEESVNDGKVYPLIICSDQGDEVQFV